MSLAEGTRLEAGPERAYVVGPVAWETPLHVARHAHRVFWNDRDAGRTRVEAAPEEWLPVVLRVPRDGEAARRQGFECDVLRPALREADAPGLAPLLDRVPLSEDRGEAVVLGWLPGRTLAGHLDGGQPDAAPLAAVFLDLFDLLRGLHGRDWTAGGLDADDLWIADRGRWAFRPSDRIAPATGPDDLRADLDAWAALARRILAAGRPASGAVDLALDLVARVERDRPPSAAALTPPRRSRFRRLWR